jgi:hypothetical protein
MGARSMARRPGGDGAAPLTLSPRVLRIGGWVVAILLIAGIAVVVGLLGGDADEPLIGGGPSASADTAAGPEIAFGTALDAATGEVATDARTDRFAEGDTFVYSVEPSSSAAPPSAVYVEVRRVTAEAEEIVQAPVDAQVLPNPAVIAFRVPTEDLLAVFGPGEYRMLIYADPEADPVAEGSFILVAAPGAGASANPSVAP